MMNAQNVKYFDSLLSHILEIAGGQLELKDAINLCDGSEGLAEEIAEKLEKKGFVFLAKCYEGTTIILASRGKAKLFLEQGGFSAEYVKLHPPKTPAELLNEHFYMIVNNEGYPQVDDAPREQLNMDRRLISYGLVKKVNDWIVPTDEGLILADSDRTVQEYISRMNTPQPATINVNGNYIGGSNYNSPLTVSNISGSSNMVRNGVAAIPKEEGKRSLLEKLSWVAGIVGGCWATWEFIVKNLIN